MHKKKKKEKFFHLSTSKAFRGVNPIHRGVFLQIKEEKKITLFTHFPRYKILTYTYIYIYVLEIVERAGGRQRSTTIYIYIFFYYFHAILK